MKSYVFVVIVAISFLLAKTEIAQIEQYSRKMNARIIEGTPAEVGQFPWQVLIQTKKQNNKRYLCGGSLIGHQWVLTAAHCMAGAKKATLKLGGVTAGTSEIVIKKGLLCIIHPKYDSQYFHNDIALLRSRRLIQYSSTIQPVALPHAYERVGVNVPVTVSGFGRIRECGAASKVLLHVNLATISNTKCSETYGSTIIPSTLCAVGDHHHSTCTGDSGGPLVVYDDNNTAIQVGVVSFGHWFGCEKGYPTGYIRTASFRNWILKQTGI